MGKKSKRRAGKQKVKFQVEKFYTDLSRLSSNVKEDSSIEYLDRIRDIVKRFHQLNHKNLLNKQLIIKDFTQVGISYSEILSSNYKEIILEDIDLLKNFDHLIYVEQIFLSFLDIIENSPDINISDWSDLIIEISNQTTQKHGFEFEAGKVIQYIKLQAFDIAHHFYTKIHEFVGDKIFLLQRDIFNECFVLLKKNKNIKKFEKIIDKFNINPQSITDKFAEYGNERPFLPLHYTTSIEKYGSVRAEYINLLCGKYKLSPNFSFINKDNLDETPLVFAIMSKDMEIVRALVKHGADLNYVIKNHGNSNYDDYYTIFSIAINYYPDINVLKELISLGANPLTQAMLSSSKLIINDDYIKICYIHIKKELGNEYSIKVCDLIVNYYRKKVYQAFKDAENKLNAANNLKAKIKTNNKTELETLQKETKQSLDEANKLLNDYIQVKEYQVQQTESLVDNSNTQDLKKIQDEFDLLILKFFATRSEDSLLAAQNHILENPILKYYSVTKLIENEADEGDAQEIFAYNPKLLHKFFEIKKEQEYLTPADNQDIELPNNSYKIHVNGFKNDIYVILSEELSNDEHYTDSLRIKTEKLLNNPNFIKSNSKGRIGIKFYNEIFRLKFDNGDYSLASGVKFVDKNTGDILIIFNKLVSHKTKTSTIPVMEIELESFAPIWTYSTKPFAESELLVTDNSGNIIGDDSFVHTEGLD